MRTFILALAVLLCPLLALAAMVTVDGGYVFGGVGGVGRGGSADDLKGEAGLKNRENTINSMLTTASPEIQAKVKKMMLTDAPERTAVEARTAMFGPRDTGGPFDFPSLGIHAGKRNRTAPTSLPSTKIIEMEGVGHFLMLEKPAEFNKLLGDFLATAAY
jgi:pimeloyl-ACP methyl ester carboxylesterase